MAEEVKQRAEVPVEWNRLTEQVIGLAMEVHRLLGPGLLERLYEDALVHELSHAGVRFERQKLIRLKYKGVELSEMRLDLVVENLVIVELKSIERVLDAHSAQLLSDLRAADLPLGLIINFYSPHLRNGLVRRIHQTSSRFPSSSGSSLRLSASSASSAFDPIP